MPKSSDPLALVGVGIAMLAAFAFWRYRKKKS